MFSEAATLCLRSSGKVRVHLDPLEREHRGSWALLQIGLYSLFCLTSSIHGLSVWEQSNAISVGLLVTFCAISKASTVLPITVLFTLSLPAPSHFYLEMFSFCAQKTIALSPSSLSSHFSTPLTHCSELHGHPSQHLLPLSVTKSTGIHWSTPSDFTCAPRLICAPPFR